MTITAAHIRRTIATARPIAPAASADSACVPRWNTALFYALIVVLLIPLWWFRAFPSQDGPSHAYAAVVARDYDRADRPRFREFFEKNDRPVPNWVCPHLMPLLAAIMPVDVAEKIILSLYLILLPVSARYALGAIRPRSAGLAIGIFPFVPNFYYHSGFLDFCVALPVFFFAVGYWLKHRRDFRVANCAVLAAILLAGFFCHLVPTGLAGMFIAILALLMGGGPMRARLRRLAPVIAAGAPVALLTAWFILSQRGAPAVQPYPYPSRLSRLIELIHFQKAFASWEVLLAGVNLMLFAGISALLIWRRRGRKIVIGVDALLLVAGVCGGLLLLAPDAGAGGSLLIVRLAIFPFLALLLWWGAQPIAAAAFRRLRLTCALVSTAVLLLLVGSMCISYEKFAPYFEDVNAAVDRIPPNSTLMFTALPFNATRGPDGGLLSHGPDIFMHRGSELAADRGIALVNSMVAATNYQAIQYRPDLNPGVDDLIDFTAHAARIGKPIEYVLVWTGGSIPNNAPTRRIYQQLRSDYDLIYTSPATGDAQLYRRKPHPALANSDVDR